MKRAWQALVLVFVLAIPGIAQDKTKVSDLAWMAGDWSATVGANTADRSCSEPVGESMMCMMRVIADGKVVWLEFSVLRAMADGVVLDTRFFSGDAQPAQPISNELRLKHATGSVWTFENPNGTQPKSETITRDGPRAMSAHADLIDSHGKASSIDSKWQRVH
ncbi:MAG TPA: DUF6265 family protein [Terracidiphilus sp.]|jgi:hypothetical protein|nr:DUF6265 family protein [Terracidiphilus sp.]